MSKTLSIISILLLTILILMQIGCGSYIGYHLGNTIDNAGSKISRENLQKLENKKPGKELTIEMKDSTIIQGKLNTLSSLPDSVYSLKLANFGAEYLLPQLHDSLILTLTDNSSIKGEFLGFNFLRKETSNQFSAFLMRGGNIPIECRLSQNHDLSIPLGYIYEMHNTSGDYFTGENLQQIAKSQSIPINSVIELVNGSGNHKIPFDDIEEVRFERSKVRWIGLGVGIAVDLAAIAILGILLDGDMMENSSWGI